MVTLFIRTVLNTIVDARFIAENGGKKKKLNREPSKYEKVNKTSYKFMVCCELNQYGMLHRMREVVCSVDFHFNAI